MAIQQVKKLLQGVLDKAEDQMLGSGKIKGLGSTYIIQLTFGGDEAIESFIGGVNFAFKDLNTKDPRFVKMNSVAVWTKALRKTITGLNKLGQYNLTPMPKRVVPGPGVYLFNRRIRGGTPNLEIIICGKKAGSRDRPGGIASNAMAKSFTKQLWDNWLLDPQVDKIMKLISGPQDSNLFGPTTTRTSSKGIAKTKADAFEDWKEGGKEGGAQLAHKEKTTEGVITMREIEQNMPNVNLGYGFTSHNLVQLFRENTELDYEEINHKKDVGDYEFDSFIHMRMAKNFPGSEITDLSQAKKFWYKAIEEIIVLTPGLTDAKRKLSKSPASKATDDVIATIVGGMKGKKTVKKVKSKAQKMKKTERRPKKKAVTPAGSRKPVRQKATAKVKGAAVMPIKKPKEKQKEKEIGSFLKIEAFINKRLSKQVQNNMGRPALRNQTGRFANSTEVQNLRKTKAGISGEYTYQLSPYETFENTGRARWPKGYNPKPLIAKSIRELALGVTEEKLVSLRRV